MGRMRACLRHTHSRGSIGAANRQIKPLTSEDVVLINVSEDLKDKIQSGFVDTQSMLAIPQATVCTQDVNVSDQVQSQRSDFLTYLGGNIHSMGYYISVQQAATNMKGREKN